MNEKMLPIGSVVKLKDLEKPVMIFGYLQKCGVEHIQTVDYIGVPYPEGNVGPYAQIGFQRTDIINVLFEGYRTEEIKPWEDRFEKYKTKSSN